MLFDNKNIIAVTILELNCIFRILSKETKCLLCTRPKFPINLKSYFYRHDVRHGEMNVRIDYCIDFISHIPSKLQFHAE